MRYGINEGLTYVYVRHEVYAAHSLVNFRRILQEIECVFSFNKKIIVIISSRI